MAKPKERIIRDPSGPATVSQETLRQAAKKIWDGKRAARRNSDDGQFTEHGDGSSSHRETLQQGTENTPVSRDGTSVRLDSGTGRFANAPALKPNRT